jgi:lauroyl/myristoyl acyltransferase
LSAARRALQGGRRLAGVLPAPAGRGLAESTAVALSRRPGDRAWARRRTLLARHLVRVLGPEAPPPGSRAMARLVDAAIASYARYWAETLRLPAVSRERLLAGIVYDGYEHIAAGRAAGRGTILVLPHLGGWEWAGAQLAAIGHPVSVVAERLEPADLFEWFRELRQGLGMNVIEAGPGSAAACAAALADNHLLCLLCDRLLAGAAGVDVEFFGETTRLPAGPATLALRSGARLLPAAVYFEPGTERHRGVVRPPLALTRSGRGQLRADVARITGDLAREFEGLIRAAPTQWHLLQPNWPSDLPAG